MKECENNRLAGLWSHVVSLYDGIHARSDPPALGIHDIDHVARVWANVKQILSEGEGERLRAGAAELVEAATMLHDLGYSKLTAPETERREHLQWSLALCSQPLEQAGYSRPEIASVRTMIASHHRLDHATKSLEEKILYLADKLDMIGFDGTVRMFMKYSSATVDISRIGGKLFDKLKERVEEDLLRVGIGGSLVKERWSETEELLRGIIRRSEASGGVKESSVDNEKSDDRH